MKSQIIAFSILVSLFLVGCTDRNALHRDELNEHVGRGIVAYGSIQGDRGDKGTRVLVENAKALSDMVFLRVDHPSNTLSVVDFSNSANITATREAGAAGKITFTPTQSYDIQTDRTAYIAGYYPAGVISGTDPRVVEWPINGVDDIILSKAYSAGKLSAQTSPNIEFSHLLARVEVVLQCKAGANLATVRAEWGKITSIKLLDVPTTMAYNYATNAVSFGTDKGSIKLTGGVNYDLGTPTLPIDIPASGSTAVYAAAMVAPQAQTTLQFRVTTTGGQINGAIISTTLGVPIVAGKVHRITLDISPFQPLFSIIDNLRWATGSLVADGANVNGVGTGSPALGISVKPVGYTGGTDWTTSGYYKDGAIESLIPLVGNAAIGIGGFWQASPAVGYRAKATARSTARVLTGIIGVLRSTEPRTVTA